MDRGGVVAVNRQLARYLPAPVLLNLGLFIHVLLFNLYLADQGLREDFMGRQSVRHPFDVLGLPAVSDVMRQFLLWLPNLVVAMVVLFVSGIAARGLGNMVRGATAEGGFSNPDTLANVARTAVWAFGIVVAVNQLGIATALINTIVMGVVGAIALAAGLAFGLGGRDLAQNSLKNWYEKGQDAKPRA